MQTFFEILKYVLPSLVVLAASIYLVKAFLDNEETRKLAQIKLDVQKISLPVRMQAYERLVLLLERLQLSGLLLRNNAPGMNSAGFQNALLQSVRDEFDHNLSQQLYVSSLAWEKVKNAREETIKLIHTAASKVDPEASSSELARQILVHDMEIVSSACDQALDFLKAEAREFFF